MKGKGPTKLARLYEAALFKKIFHEVDRVRPWPGAEIRNAYLAGYRAAKREKVKRK